MEYKLFTSPQFHDDIFYKNREEADHIHQENGHRQRLLEVVEMVKKITKNRKQTRIVDLGCGNGGLLHELQELGYKNIKGYDLQPSNVEGSKKYNVPVEYLDFVNNIENIENANIYILTEVLEHLVDPHKLLSDIKDKCKYVIASTPWNETDTSHYEYHLWAWTDGSLADVFRDAGYTVESHYVSGISQFIMAKI